MSNENEQKPSAAITTQAQSDWQLLQRQCNAFIQSGFLPDHISKGAKSPQEAIARAVTIAWKGRELGIPPLQSFSSITVINGKPCLAAELMLALCYQRVKGFQATFTTPPDRQHLECTIVVQRGGGQPQTFRFSMEDANRAGVVRQGSPWTKFPAAMLRARAVSAACRAVCPDAIMGCYTPEEMGGEVLEGEVVEQQASTTNVVQPETRTTNVVPEPTHRLGGTTDDYKPAHPDWMNQPCTEAQIKRLYALGKKAGYYHEQLTDLAGDLFEVEHLKDLTKGQIQELFREFEEGEKPKAAPPPVGSDEDIQAAADEAQAAYEEQRGDR